MNLLDALSFRNLHLFNSNVTKTQVTFCTKVHYKAMTNLNGTFKCARSRCKTCSFIHNVEKISEDQSDPLRSLITSRDPLPMSAIA